MTCDEAREARLDRASGPLASDRERALEAHVAGCPSCLGFTREIDALEGLLTTTLQGVETDLAALLVLPRHRAPFAWLAWLAWLTAVAGIATAVVLVARLRRGHEGGDAPGAVLAGVAAFRLEGGATVTLGTASQAHLEAPRTLDLDRGRVHCLVPSGHGPFNVRTALGSVRVVGTEFTVELLLREDPMNLNRPTVAASALIVGVVSGVVLVRAVDGAPTPVSAGQVAIVTPREGTEVQSLADVKANALAAREVPGLKAALARAEAHARDLEQRLSAVAPVDSGATGAVSAVSSGSTQGAAADTAEEVVKKAIKSFDWHAGTSAFAAYSRAQSRGSTAALDPSIYLEMSKMNVVIAEIAKARGYSSPWQAYADPEVRAVFAPAWLDALGADLDPSQTAAVVQRIQSESSSWDPNAPEQGYLADMRTTLESKLSYENYLATLLRPDQEASYLASVGNDPYFGMQHGQVLAGDPASLVPQVSASWTKAFGLPDTVAAAVQDVAGRYVQAAGQLPAVDPSLDPAAARAANMSRAVSLLALQEQAEKDLAGISGLSDAERARVVAGSNTVLEVQPSR